MCLGALGALTRICTNGKLFWAPNLPLRTNKAQGSFHLLIEICNMVAAPAAYAKVLWDGFAYCKLTNVFAAPLLPLDISLSITSVEALKPARRPPFKRKATGPRALPHGPSWPVHGPPFKAVREALTYLFPTFSAFQCCTLTTHLAQARSCHEDSCSLRKRAIPAPITIVHSSLYISRHYTLHMQQHNATSLGSPPDQ